MELREKIEVLRRQGVNVPAPETLEIGDEVALERVRGPGTTLHACTKLYGADLLVLPGARVGYEEPATLEGCAVGRNVQLGGGTFAGAVFLDGVVLGKGAHVRGGTLMEEQSSGAHCVGLKQTVLLPFVTLGSLINFCDVLMAGGTSRQDHSEVGSSFIHFNFTPFGRHGDKATPSLVGDVPRGVTLRAPRIFLGGQGGLVGPVHIDYGTALAAGTVYRRDYGPGLLVVGEHLPSRTIPFSPRRYGRIRRKVEKNLTYIGNLVALWHWYARVRLPLAGSDGELAALYARGQAALAAGIAERIKRLGQIAGYMEDSLAELAGEEGPAQERADQRAFQESWPAMEARLRAYPELDRAPSAPREALLAALEQASVPGDYLATIRALPAAAAAAATDWLAAIVGAVEAIGF